MKSSMTPKNEMIPRERVWATVKGEPVDRVPFFIWLNPHAACKVISEFRPSKSGLWNSLARFGWRKFIQGGEFDAKEIWRAFPLIFDYHLFNWANAYSPDLGSDIILAVPATPWQFGKLDFPALLKGRLQFHDMFGSEIVIGGIYPDMRKPAIADIGKIKDFKLPDPKTRSFYNIFRKYRNRFPDYSLATEVFGAEDYPTNFLFGFENFMVNLAMYPVEMKAFLKRWSDYQVELLVQSIRAGADIAFIGDDYGYNNTTILSPAMWKEFIYPSLKRLIDVSHEEGALALLHSCGYQMTMLPYYAEAGLDMLHAFQPLAGNDFEKAYMEYGDRLTFVTGIDIQRGEAWSPQKMREEILASYGTGGRKGRHVLATSHEMQYTMPLENIRSIFTTLDEITQGMHD